MFSKALILSFLWQDENIMSSMKFFDNVIQLTTPGAKTTIYTPGLLSLVYPEALFPWLHGQSRPILWRQSSCTQDPTGVGWGIPTRGMKWESLSGFNKARQGVCPRIYKLLFWEINYKINCCLPTKTALTFHYIMCFSLRLLKITATP